MLLMQQAPPPLHTEDGSNGPERPIQVDASSVVRLAGMLLEAVEDRLKDSRK